MKKLIFILLMMLCLLGCRKHVYDTYYGKVDIDTLEHADGMDINDPDCVGYTVAHKEDTIIYYNPVCNRYYFCFPTNDEHGNAIMLYNPYTGKRTIDFE